MSKSNRKTPPLDPRLRLEPQVQKQLLKALQEHYLDICDEEIGDLAAGLLLEQVLRDLGPLLYNRGIQDATTFLQDRIDDLYGLEVPSMILDRR